MVAGTKAWVWLGVLVLFVVHQDLWLWSDGSLWLNALPAGLGYHALYSVVVSLFWLVVVRLAWPQSLEGEEDEEVAP